MITLASLIELAAERGIDPADLTVILVADADGSPDRFAAVATINDDLDPSSGPVLEIAAGHQL